MYPYLHVGRANDLSDSRDRKVYRFFEILPGLLAWITLALVVFASFEWPVFAAIFIIAFDIYWFTKTVYLSLLMRSAFYKMRKNLTINWLETLSQLPTTNYRLPTIRFWQDIYHLVILPMANEPLEVVRQGFLELIKVNYPLDRFIVVLATEERIGDKAQAIAKKIEEEFGSKFFKFLATKHSDNLKGEMRGKGSNETWAAREAKKDIVDSLGISYEKIIVSVFDIDTVVHSDFFACLTYHYLTAEKPLRSSYQPIPLFVNNIWEAPAFARVFAFSTTFWQMIQQSRHEQLVTFSSQSIGFGPLVEAGFWQTNVVSEDSRIFWQCLLNFDGDWRTIPMYFPIYMDANVAPTLWQTFKNQYKQIRRWLYGVENNPYFMFGFLKNKKIPFRDKLYFSLQMTEKSHSSPTSALIIFLLGWLPIWLGGAEFNRSILSYNLPRITSFIMYLAMLGLVTSAIVSIILLPPKPPQYGKFKWAWMVLQWLLFPINFIVFGALPALDAQTRLMLGKYMGFWVTPKIRR